MRLKITFISIFISLTINAQYYKFTHFNSENKFTEAFVYSIVQDNSGYLWLGTSNGLYRYNGFSFKFFTQNDSLATNFITAGTNHNGVTWFGHRTGELTMRNKYGFEKILPPTEEFSSIVQFETDRKKQLWAASYSNGLLKIKSKNEIEHYKFEEEITIQTFKFITDSTLLIGSDDGVRICYLKPSGIITVKKYLVDLPKQKVSAITNYNKNSFIIATEEYGVYLLEIFRQKITVVPIVKSEHIGGDIISSLLIDKNREELWISTFGGGMYQKSLSNILEEEPSNLCHYSLETSDYVKCIFQDRDENIWLGNYGAGVTKISRNPFRKEIIENPEHGKIILSMATRDSFRWVGTNKAVLCYKGNKLIQTYSVENGLPADKVGTLYISALGVLWAGTADSGLYKLAPNEGKFTKFNISAGLLENRITALAGNKQYTWVGTKKGLAQIELATGEIKWYTIRKGGLPHNVVKNIFIDSDNVLWITTQSTALSYLKNGDIKKIDISSENGTFILNAITKDTEGNVWVASNGMGLFKLMNDSVLNLKEKEGLFSDYCYSVLPDKQGFIWVCHRGGISRVNIKTLSVRAIQKQANISKDDEFSQNASIVDKKGMLWFGTTNGILSYNPKLENKCFLAPIINITSVKANGIEQDIKKKIKLPAGKYKIKIDYIGISLKEPGEVKYQFRLKGYDNGWSVISKNRTVTYTNLDSGHYLFELNSSSSDGVTTQLPHQIEIIIKKPLWSYWWFYFIVLALLSGTILINLKRRERKLIKDKASLELRVQERTREIQLQNDKIRKQGEVIHNKNIDITDSIKYARTIQSAIFPPEEILKEALPEYFLINKPKDIVSGDFCWYTKQKGKYIIAVTDCTGHGVPGAIMSMLGITLFNEVVNNMGITDSGEILEMVRDKVISALNQHKKENPSYDGMNVGLCVIDSKKNYLQYSGAYHNLVHFHKKELNIVKAERSPIGFSPLGKPSFKAHKVDYAPGDMFYLYSDGYQDQFGGEDDKKFTNRRLLNILADVQDKSMNNQKIVIEQTLSYWMKNEEQTDDVIMLGFRL